MQYLSRQVLRILGIFMVVVLLYQPAQATTTQRQTADNVYLAYVHEGIVTLADQTGLPIIEVGPSFEPGQSASIFWDPTGDKLFIARRDGLWQSNAQGAQAVQLPGTYGLTLTLDRRGQVLYYLESNSPQENNANTLSFPLREANLANLSTAPGRFISYVGAFGTGSAATLTGAAMQYARGGGLLGPSRPRLFATFGETLFYSCCFPAAGLNAINIRTGETWQYAGLETLIPGASATNRDYSRLAGPTTDGHIVVVDLITGGTRRYVLDLGTIERVAWSPDNTTLYLAVRRPSQDPLQLNAPITTEIDTRSAQIAIWRLNLITGGSTQLTVLGDFYGVPSMAATEDYVFVVVTERNARLVADLNAGRLPADISTDDPRLIAEYLPGSILYRITSDGSEAFSIMADVWGVRARPR
ncbi:MAG: hypothetical protein GYB66_14510 [Chloroflexi bacterium]|nr:hypothetical protein [Chloroflexota bacterium]